MTHLIWHRRRQAKFWSLFPFIGLSMTTHTVCRANDNEQTAPNEIALGIAAPSAKTSWDFVFGEQKAKNTLSVTSTNTYSAATGYGFETGSDVKTADGFVTASHPFFFSAAVPEGNYRVTIVLGDPSGESNTTVKAEARRLMLENVSTSRGQTVIRSFTVSVHTPTLTTGGLVRINEREKGRPHWDEKLTLEFNGTRPCVRSLKIEKEAIAPTIFLAGDSTVTDQAREPYAAWGQMLPRFFKPGLAVANYAESGLTLNSFRAQKRLEKILGEAKIGDVVFIQFGHNDQKEKGEGVGPFTTYAANLKEYIAKIRDRGASVVLVTPMERRRWQGDQPQATLQDFAQAVREVGAAEQVPVIDLNTMSLRFYAALGAEPSKKAFAYATVKDIPGLTESIQDNTHFSNYGAYELARCIVQGIREKVPSLVPFIAGEVNSFDPATPDAFNEFAVPASPFKMGEKPAGS